MKKLNNLLKGHRYIAFLDFEGTQFSHEMIAVGAVLASLDKNAHIKKLKPAFKIYVKAKNKIGKYVTDLTGITQDILDKKGVSFSKAMQELKKYLGIYFKKSSFVTYGNHDMRILGHSISYNLDAPKNLCQQIQKNYIDFSVFINEFIRDKNGNPLSLIHNCELFNVVLVGEAHDPAVDAINLANLYDAFLNHMDLVAEQYKRAIVKSSHFPAPIASIVKKLNAGETITPDIYEQEIKEYLE